MLVGAESTGKTTLAAELARRLGTVWNPEFGREYWEQKAHDWQMKPPVWSTDEFVRIATEQKRREELLARRARDLLVCDTNAWTTGFWHERYLNCRSPAVDVIGAGDVADLYLLTDIDVPFVQDGWRDGEAIRRQMHQRFWKRFKRTAKRLT